MSPSRIAHRILIRWADGRDTTVRVQRSRTRHEAMGIAEQLAEARIAARGYGSRYTLEYLGGTTR